VTPLSNGGVTADLGPGNGGPPPKINGPCFTATGRLGGGVGGGAGAATLTATGVGSGGGNDCLAGVVAVVGVATVDGVVDDVVAVVVVMDKFGVEVEVGVVVAAAVGVGVDVAAVGIILPPVSALDDIYSGFDAFFSSCFGVTTIVP